MMKRQICALGLAAMFWLANPSPTFAVSKEMVQLQTQVQGLQDQMSRMQQAFDERMGVMKNLIDQSTDNINKMTVAVDSLQKNLQQQNTDSAGKVDQVSGQVQALHDSVDELKARLAKFSKQLDDIQAAQQNMTTQPGAPGAGGTPGTSPQSQAPPPDVLYNSALGDFNAGKNDLAAQEFTQYLQAYGNTDLAGNAQFYLGEIDYRKANYQDRKSVV